MNFDYCYKKCKLGKSKSAHLLAINNSAYDAAIDFRFFVDECYKTCPHKDQHVITPVQKDSADISK